LVTLGEKKGTPALKDCQLAGEAPAHAPGVAVNKKKSKSLTHMWERKNVLPHQSSVLGRKVNTSLVVVRENKKQPGAGLRRPKEKTGIEQQGQRNLF